MCPWVLSTTQRASLWILFPEKDSPGPAVISGSPQVEFDPQTSLPPASAQLWTGRQRRQPGEQKWGGNSVSGIGCSSNWRRQWHPTPVLLPGKSHGRRSLVGCSPWGRWESELSDFTFTFHVHALEKEMATHSSVLAWRIPGTAEPGGLPSMGSHRVGHDWSDLAAAAAANRSRSSLDRAEDKPVTGFLCRYHLGTSPLACHWR